MSLTEGVKQGFTAVATEIQAFKLAVAGSMHSLHERIEELEASPKIIVSATEPSQPEAGTIWLDISGV